jgi:hypothetical protein
MSQDPRLRELREMLNRCTRTLTTDADDLLIEFCEALLQYLQAEQVGGGTPAPADAQDESIVRWLRGAGYDDAANALAELHVEDCALKGIKPRYFVAPTAASGTPDPPTEFVRHVATCSLCREGLFETHKGMCRNGRYLLDFDLQKVRPAPTEPER